MAQLDQIQQWLSLSPDEFEGYVAELWRQMGYEVEVTSSSRDGGVDVFAYPKNPTKGTEVIQVKRHSPSNKVGSPTVQQIAGVAQQFDAPNAVIVTTASFTNDAETAGLNSNVELIDGAELERLHRKYLDNRNMGVPPISDWPNPFAESTSGIPQSQATEVEGPIERIALWFAVVFTALIAVYISIKWVGILL